MVCAIVTGRGDCGLIGSLSFTELLNVCMHAGMHVSMCVCMRGPMDGWMDVFVCVCVCANVRCCACYLVGTFVRVVVLIVCML